MGHANLSKQGIILHAHTHVHVCACTQIHMSTSKCILYFQPHSFHNIRQKGPSLISPAPFSWITLCFHSSVLSSYHLPSGLHSLQKELLSDSSSISIVLYFWLITAQMFSFCFVLYNMRKRQRQRMREKFVYELWRVTQQPWFSNVSIHQNHLKSSIQHDCWTCPRVSHSIGLDRIWKCEFLTISQVMLMLAALRSHLKNPCDEILLIILKLPWGFFLIPLFSFPLRGQLLCWFLKIISLLFKNTLNFVTCTCTPKLQRNIWTMEYYPRVKRNELLVYRITW